MKRRNPIIRAVVQQLRWWRTVFFTRQTRRHSI